MASFTKRAILISFFRMCTKKSPDKITVREIVDDCEINRNTFYYYFEDIYALVQELFVLASQDFCNACREGNIREGILSLQKLVEDNTAAMRNLYLSFGYRMEGYYLFATEEGWIAWLRQTAEGKKAGEEALRYVADSYAAMFFSLMRKQLGKGKNADIPAATERFIRVWIPLAGKALEGY